MDKLGRKKDKTTTGFYLLINWYRKLNDNELADKYEKELLQKEPKGYHAEFQQYYECALEKSFDKKRKLTIAFINDFPNSDYIERLHEGMIASYINMGQFREAEKEYRIKKLEELKEQMLDKPAPPFTLNDLDSNIVSLADFKGKIVVLDFWATWCGPCLQSFPAMQKSMDIYNSDDKIKFLFIDTWEKGDDVDKKVSDFIRKNNYTFHVLRDVENSVVSAYNVSGIPTKFVIDPKGNIRFRIKGYGGNDTQLIEELDMIIGMLR